MIKEEHASLSGQIAIEVARILRETAIFASPPRPARTEWITLPEAAQILGYSTSRFYHIYGRLGLTPSRTSRRKMRFRRQDIDNFQTLCQNRKVNHSRHKRVPRQHRMEQNQGLIRIYSGGGREKEKHDVD